VPAARCAERRNFYGRLSAAGFLGAAALCALAAAVGGCGGSSSSSKVAAYPPGAGTSIDRLRKGLPERGMLAPSGAFFEPGSSRVAFALFDAAHRVVSASSVAVYTADVQGNDVRGPFPATDESLAVAPRFQSKTVAQDPQAAHGVWVARVVFSGPGPHRLMGLAQVGAKRVTTTLDQVDVGTAGPAPPRVGQRAPSIHTPTVASVGGDAARIDTRDPPASDLQAVDFASVVGRRPVVLMFATPALCQSRVCGPVVDIEDQVASQLGSRAAFVHMEIYNDNNPSRGLRPQVNAYHLPTEPWTFVIDRHGIVRVRIEGALSVDELAAAVRQVAAIK
jgi:hypothetical protein